MERKLEQTFLNLIRQYHQEEAFNMACWQEIERNYSANPRHYHNLLHLQKMISELEDCQPQLQDWDAILFSVYYHDIIYNVRRSDNEVKSADFMESRLSKTSFQRIEHCKMQIKASKNHQESEDSDTNYFLDADLSILGQDWPTYENYVQQIRKEYRIYPEFLYKRGRKKVLRHFLDMESVYHTNHFADKYESRARNNLKRELQAL